MHKALVPVCAIAVVAGVFYVRLFAATFAEYAISITAVVIAIAGIYLARALKPKVPQRLQITSVPPGKAPLWVRERWVGLSLPLAHASPIYLPTSGVLSGPKGFLSGVGALLTGKLKGQRGFVVEARAAIDALAQSSPEAAQWWRENTPHLLKGSRRLVFPEAVGQVVESDGGPGRG